MSLATALLNRWLLGVDEYQWSMAFSPLGFVIALVAAMFLDVGGLGEETGWRGFALPHLQSRYGPLQGTLLLGVLWALWHIPAKPDLLLGGPFYFLQFFGIFTLRLVALSIVMTAFFNRVGGSTLLAVMMHGLHNDSLSLQGRLLADTDAVFFISEITLLIPIVIVAATTLVVTRGTLAYREVARV
jgi:membrane protease YdiL (CAAX protease family)